MRNGIYFFGTGKFLQNNSSMIPWECISGIVDRDETKWGTRFCEKEVSSPAILRDTDAHTVVITSVKYFFEIFQYLHYDLGIPSHKIIGFNTWLYRRNPRSEAERGFYMRCFDEVFGVLSFRGMSHVLDYGASLVRLGDFDFPGPMFSRWKNIAVPTIDSFASDGSFLPENFYGKRYTNLHELSSVLFDAVLLLGRISGENLEEHLRVASLVSARYVVLRLDSDDKALKARAIQALGQYGQVEVQPLFTGGSLFLVPRELMHNSEAPDVCVKIYIVTHKKFDAYMERRDSGYCTIFAGASGNGEFFGLHDDAGENISYLNPKINECTALYWIWKHVTSSYVGLNHYRRYFLYGEGAPPTRQSILTSSEAWRYLQQYDIIVASRAVNYESPGVINTMASGVERNAVDTGMRIVRRLLAERQPGYVEAFEYVMNGSSMYPCNMFVTHRRIMDAYCTWLFSFIIDAAREIDVSSYDAYSRRIIGFIAERMLTVWLVKHKLRIKELPIYVECC